MKKLINDVQDVLDEQLAGLAKAHPSLTLHQIGRASCRERV